MPRQCVATPAATVTELLDAYRPRDFFFTSPSGSLLGQGVLTTVTGVDDLSDALHATAAEPGRHAVAVGALPFNRTAPARLVIPATVQRGPAIMPGTGATRARRPGTAPGPPPPFPTPPHTPPRSNAPSPSWPAQTAPGCAKLSWPAASA